MTASRRMDRFRKYREADPNVEWQRSYSHLLDDPGRVRRWYERSPHLPTVAHEPVVDATPLRPGEPAMSAIVIARDDEERIERAVGAVVSQVVDGPLEIIVVTSGTDRTAAIVRDAFPSVTVVELERPALPGSAQCRPPTGARSLRHVSGIAHRAGAGQPRRATCRASSGLAVGDGNDAQRHSHVGRMGFVLPRRRQRAPGASVVRAGVPATSLFIPPRPLDRDRWLPRGRAHR